MLGETTFAMTRFELFEWEPRPGCREIEVHGELDSTASERLREAIERASRSHDRVLIGLAACDFIDSTGIATILSARQRLGAQGRLLAVHGAGAQVERVLAITGLFDDGLVFDSSIAALDAAPLMH